MDLTRRKVAEPRGEIPRKIPGKFPPPSFWAAVPDPSNLRVAMRIFTIFHQGFHSHYPRFSPSCTHRFHDLPLGLSLLSFTSCFLLLKSWTSFGTGGSRSDATLCPSIRSSRRPSVPNASVSDNRGTAGVPFDQRITTQPRKYGKIARCDFSGSIDQFSR